jgi:hypothetical protein
LEAQDAAGSGLKGKVQTVFSEEFTSKDGVSREPNGSTLDVYDPAGYQLEFFRYKPDGSLWVHTVYDRKGPYTVRVQAVGTEPFESRSEQNVFDAEGHVVETDIYDANGVLVSKSINNLVERQANSSVYQHTETTTERGENTTVITETRDRQTGITRQVATKNGQVDTDWVIQRNADGTEKDKIVYADGSYNERERRTDETTVEDQYYAPTKRHTYQNSDSQGHIVELVRKSDSDYLHYTYSFDKAGRPTGQVNYDTSGNILDKSTEEYRDDSHGNWIEKKSIVWDTKTEPMQPKIVAFTLRTINYY